MEKLEIVDSLEAILKGNPWDVSKNLRAFIEKLRKSYVPKQRTSQQNKALWLYFRLVAEALTESGQGMKKILKPEVDIDWNEKLIHDYMWLPLQKAILHIDSTRDLKKTGDIDKVYDHLNRFLATKGVHIPFPSEQDVDNYKLDAIHGGR